MSYLVGRALVKLPYFSLVNLLAGRAVVPELLQGELTTEAVAGRSSRCGRPGARAAAQGLEEVRARLGGPGAARRAADEVLSLCWRLQVASPAPARHDPSQVFPALSSTSRAIVFFRAVELHLCPHVIPSANPRVSTRCRPRSPRDERFERLAVGSMSSFTRSFATSATMISPTSSLTAVNSPRAFIFSV